MALWYKIAQAKGGAAPPPPLPPPPPPPPPMGGGGPPPAGGGPAGPSEQRVGTLSGVRSEDVNDNKSDDRKRLRKLNKAFKNALEGGHSMEDAAAMAIMANGSSVAPHQLDIAETFDPDFSDQDPPFIRRIMGLDLGSIQGQPGDGPPPPSAPPPL